MALPISPAAARSKGIQTARSTFGLDMAREEAALATKIHKQGLSKRIMNNEVPGLSPKQQSNLRRNYMDAMDLSARPDIRGAAVTKVGAYNPRGLLKMAAVFGASMPDGLEMNAIPYDLRKSRYEDYVHSKANEKPTGLMRGGLTGGAAGGLTGGILGGLGGVMSGGGVGQGALAGGLSGGILGGLTGLLMAAVDRGDIRRAKQILKDNNIDESFLDHVVNEQRGNEAAQELNSEMRHREMLHAIQGRDPGPFDQRVRETLFNPATFDLMPPQRSGMGMGGEYKQASAGPEALLYAALEGKEKKASGSTNVIAKAKWHGEDPKEMEHVGRGIFATLKHLDQKGMLTAEGKEDLNLMRQGKMAGGHYSTVLHSRQMKPEAVDQAYGMMEKHYRSWGRGKTAFVDQIAGDARNPHYGYYR